MDIDPRHAAALGLVQDAVNQLVSPAAVSVTQVVVNAIARGRGEVEALVEHIARPEGRADEVPGEAKQRGAVGGVEVVGAVQELVE
jgi:hypothetical protein